MLVMGNMNGHVGSERSERESKVCTRKSKKNGDCVERLRTGFVDKLNFEDQNGVTLKRH